MGSAESRVAFKNKILKMAGVKDMNDVGPDSLGDEWEQTGFIPTQDPYWDMFWDEPESAEDVFNALTVNEIKIIRDSNKVNFLNLIRILAINLIRTATSKSFPDKTASTEKKLLNCVRTLTRLIPFLFEKSEFNADSNNIFWNLSYNDIGKIHNQLSGDTAGGTVGSYPSSSDIDSSLSSSSMKVNINQPLKNSPDSTKAQVGLQPATESLGQQLISVLVDLLFTRGFTLDENGIKGADFKIWEVGIGSNGKYSSPDPRLDSNRLEIMRLLITLCSKGLYSTPKLVVNEGSRFLSVLVTSIPRLQLLTLLCSLLNTVCRSCKSDPGKNGLSYNTTDTNNQYSGQKYYDLRRVTVTYSLQLLTTMLVYSLPTSDISFLHNLDIIPRNQKPHNLARSYLGRLHKENELSFIYSSLLALINRPLELAIENEANPFNLLKTNFTQSSSSSSSSGTGNGSYGSSFPALSPWSIEIFILLWEMLQCNKNFKAFVFTKRSSELLVILLYYIKFYKNHELWKSNLIRIACYLMLYLTSDELVLKQLLLPFSASYYSSKIPNFYKLSPNSPNNFTYRDFLIVQISNMLTNDEFDTIIAPNLFEYLYNLIPIKSPDPATRVILSYHSCLSIMNVINKFSSEDALKDQLKMDLLALIIRSIANSVCRYHKESRTLLFVLTKHEKIFSSLLSLVEASEYEYELQDIKEVEEEEDEENIALQKISTTNSVINTGTVTPIEVENSTGANYDEEDINVLSKEDVEKSLRPKLPVGMSVKAKSKLPLDAPLMKVWAGYRGLIVILHAIKIVKEELPGFKNLSKSETIEALIKIENIPNFTKTLGKSSPLEFLPKTKFEQLKFIWSNLSLGWYESILWGVVFYDNLATSTGASSTAWFNKRNSSISLKEVASSWGFSWRSPSHSKHPQSENFQFDNGILRLSIWSGTAIKLFKIKKTAADKPLVDVSNLMKRFRLNSTSSINTIDSRTSSLNSPIRQNSVSGFNSPNQLTPINSRQSFGTPRNSVQMGISRQNSYTS